MNMSTFNIGIKLADPIFDFSTAPLAPGASQDIISVPPNKIYKVHAICIRNIGSGYLLRLRTSNGDNIEGFYDLDTSKTLTTTRLSDSAQGAMIVFKSPLLLTNGQRIALYNFGSLVAIVFDVSILAEYLENTL